VTESATNRGCFYSNGVWRCLDSFNNNNLKYYSSCTKVSAGWSCIPYDVHNGMVQYGGSSFGYYEMNTSWDFGLSVNLLSKIRTGKNRIDLRVIVGGGGEGQVEFLTRQKCPRNCKDTWDSSQCAIYDARTQ
jgi:hypothetical protein